jgi:ring-1,2-phenylacetyl-CoA epoxidase subunit PaaC
VSGTAPASPPGAEAAPGAGGEPPALAVYALRLGDDCLVLAQRLGEWAAAGPELEEDVALLNIGLDLLGQARALLTLAGEVEGRGRDEDALAYMRSPREFLNCQLVELDNGDFAHTIVRQLLFSAYQHELYARLRGSADPTLAAIAAKGLTEVAYHRDHAEHWTLRLGDGTAESHSRMLAALDDLWPHTSELFESDDLVAGLADRGIAVEPPLLREPWQERVTRVLREATLAVPETRWSPGGGRRGLHTEAFGFMLAEMQHLHRSHPGARW